jgi:hypothetical protein
MSKPTIALDELRRLLSYDLETGVFRRRVRMGAHAAGTVCGNLHASGYRYIGIGGRRYLEHRVAWFYVKGEWPPDDLDHRKLDRANNKFSELRPATRQQNMQNIRKHCDNTSGYKGVSWHAGKKKWRATIQINGKWKHLGYFREAGKASEAYIAAANEHFGEFARAA